MTKPISLDDYRSTARAAGERTASERTVLERAAEGPTARILLFTGVRYERMDDAVPMAARSHA